MNLNLIDFFAGAGLASCGLRGVCNIVAATDIDQMKARVYQENHPETPFWISDVRDIDPATVSAQKVAIAWASFPCQDLSCAGQGAGLAGSRSSLVFDWLRIMGVVKPPVLVLENVLGLLTTAGGANYVAIIRALNEIGYAAGSVVIDASLFVPQSRPRVFIIAVPRRHVRGLAAAGCCMPMDTVPWQTTWCRPKTLVQAERPFTLSGRDVAPLRWAMDTPPVKFLDLADYIDVSAPCDPVRSAKFIDLLPGRFLALTDRFVTPRSRVWAAFRRTRDGKSVVEMRTDGMAGALRTAKGGSSRQIVVIKRGRELTARYMTVTECARIMGLPDDYRLPKSETDALMAIGDGVCVPVADYLARNLLLRVAQVCSQ